MQVSEGLKKQRWQLAKALRFCPTPASRPTPWELTPTFWGGFHPDTDFASEGCCVNFLLQKEPGTCWANRPLKIWILGLLTFCCWDFFGSQQWNLPTVAYTHSLYVTQQIQLRLIQKTVSLSFPAFYYSASFKWCCMSLKPFSAAYL